MSSTFEGWEGPQFDMKRIAADDFRDRCYVVGVTGTTGNKWGHVLLDVGGYLFHVTRACTHYPNWMDFPGLRRYFVENDKAVFYREKIPDLKNPSRARQELGKQLNETWSFGGMIKNCVTFAEYIIRQAGGSAWDLEPHLPSYGPIFHSAGYMDLEGSSGDPRASREQREFWSAQRVRRTWHPKYRDYLTDHTPTDARYHSQYYLELLDGK